GSVSFDKTQDSLFSAPTKYVKSFENEEGRRKGKSKETGTSRRNEKGKKDGEVQRGGWSFKGFTYALQVHESIPSSCADLDELNKAGYEEVDGMQWDEGPSNRNEGEENEEEDIEGGEGPNNRNEGEEKEEE
ncbi:unnamed protein product, partial [Prunus brigantina]